MLIKWIQVLALFFVLQSSNVSQAKVADWISNLIRFTKNDLRVYQVVAIFDRNETNVIPDEESIIRIFSRKLPTWKISFEETTTRKAEDLSLDRSFDDPSATSLFLIIRSFNESENLSSLYDSVEFISNISSVRSRPKCLVVVPEELNNLASDRFLRFSWSKQFIDVSILEFKYTQRKMENFATMVNYNPFTNTTTRALFQKDSSSEFKWFPDNTCDLRRFEMKVGAFHEPPYSYLNFDQNGEILDATGKDIMIIKIISQRMNFEIKWISSTEPRWGKEACDKVLTTGFVRGLIYNEINLVGLQSGRLGACIEDFYEWSTNTDPYILTVVVPIIPGEYFDLSLEWKLKKLGYLILIFMLIWLVGRLLKFDQKSWRILDILQIMISMSTLHNPQKMAEKILFGSLLLFCLLNSSFIFTAFTDVGLQKKPELELKTINDVVSSPLQSCIDSETFQELFNYSEGSSWIFLNKSIVQDITFHECLDILVGNKSSACVVKEAVAQLRIQQNKNEKNEPIMKIVDEKLHSGTMAFAFESRFPFINRFNWILRRMMEAGLFEKLEKRHFTKVESNKIHELWSSEAVKINKMLKLLTLVLFCIQSISCLVFVYELFIFYIRKRI